MEEIVKKLNAFKYAVKNGLINGTIEYTKRYRYNPSTHDVDWCDVDFTIGETKLSLSVGKYTKDLHYIKAGTFIISTTNEMLKNLFTEEEEQLFGEIVNKKLMEQYEVDEEIEYYENKIRELKHE